MDNKMLFKEIADFLAGNGFALVVEQVREELANGRLFEEKITTFAEVRSEQLSLLPEGTFKRGVPADFVKRAEYSDTESIILLLEAARRAICEPTVMVDELRVTLFADGITKIEFEPERADQQGYVVPLLPAAEPSLARERAVELDKIIHTVRGS